MYHIVGYFRECILFLGKSEIAFRCNIRGFNIHYVCDKRFAILWEENMTSKVVTKITKIGTPRKSPTVRCIAVLCDFKKHGNNRVECV